jgi:hypothetical protein
MKKLLLISLTFLTLTSARAQDIKEFVNKAIRLTEQVKDYQASGKMKTNVAFLKVPVSNIVIYYRKPDRIKIKSEKGISFIPKGAVNINVSNMLSNRKYTVIDAGTEMFKSKQLRIAKLLPEDENDDVILTTLYIDPLSSLIYKTKTTTRDNGTYELEMAYGKFAAYGLPDKIIFSFNTKDYKLPKGVTFDFDDGKERKAPVKNKKGRAEITFSSYIINKGIPQSVFN